MTTQELADAFHEFVTNGPEGLPPKAAAEVSRLTWADLQRIQAELAAEVEAAREAAQEGERQAAREYERLTDVLVNRMPQPKGRG
jgi:hypothetical protein